MCGVKLWVSEPVGQGLDVNSVFVLYVVMGRLLGFSLVVLPQCYGGDNGTYLRAAGGWGERINREGARKTSKAGGAVVSVQ